MMPWESAVAMLIASLMYKSQSRHLTWRLNLSLLELLPKQFLSLRQEPKPRSKGLHRVNRVYADRPVRPSLRRFWTKNQCIYVLRSKSRGSRARSTMIELLMPCIPYMRQDYREFCRNSIAYIKDTRTLATTT
uniref:Uncharacterized protein n=1 Tax=Trichogramma kaykai TaxID=54128 RepID=A0ABD2WEV5_9HYME